eukprot:maker-scaffold_2-snap-gene-11.51-mRNA-1 protein AED:0.00 eAED:0.00 QI:198/1/1/1/1/1/2/133/364
MSSRGSAGLFASVNKPKKNMSNIEMNEPYKYSSLQKVNRDPVLHLEVLVTDHHFAMALEERTSDTNSYEQEDCLIFFKSKIHHNTREVSIQDAFHSGTSISLSKRKFVWGRREFNPKRYDLTFISLLAKTYVEELLIDSVKIHISVSQDSYFLNLEKFMRIEQLKIMAKVRFIKYLEIDSEINYHAVLEFLSLANKPEKQNATLIFPWDKVIYRAQSPNSAESELRLATPKKMLYINKLLSTSFLNNFGKRELKLCLHGSNNGMTVKALFLLYEILKQNYENEIVLLYWLPVGDYLHLEYCYHKLLGSENSENFRMWFLYDYKRNPPVLGNLEKYYTSTNGKRWKASALFFRVFSIKSAKSGGD